MAEEEEIILQGIPSKEERIKRNIELAKKQGINLSPIPENHVPETPSTWDMLRFRLYRGWQNSPIRTGLENLEIALSPNEELARQSIALRERNALAQNAPNAYLLEQIKQARGADSVGGTLGTVAEFTGTSLDPLVFTPVGATLKTSLAIGAGTGAAINTMYQYNAGPEVNMAEAAVWGILGGAINSGVFKFSQYRAGKRAAREGTEVPSNTPPVPGEGRVLPETTINPAARAQSLRELPPEMTPEMYGDVLSKLQSQRETVQQTISKQPGTDFIPPTENPPMIRPSTEMVQQDQGQRLVELIGEPKAISLVRAVAEAPEVTPGFLDTILKSLDLEIPTENLKDLAFRLQGAKEGITAASKVSRNNFQNIGVNTIITEPPKLLALQDRIANKKTWNLLEDQWRDLSVYSKGRVKEMASSILNLKSEKVVKQRLSKIFDNQAQLERRLDNEMRELEREIYQTNVDIQSPDAYARHMSHALNKVEDSIVKVIGPKKQQDPIENLTYKVNQVYWDLIGEGKPKYILISDIKRTLSEQGAKIPEKEIDTAIGKLLGDKNIKTMDLKKGPGIYMDKPLMDQLADEAAQSWHKRRVERAASIARETGNTDPRVLNFIAQASVGGTIGYASTGEGEGALLGAAIGAGIAPATRAIMNGRIPYRLTNTIGDMKDWFNRIDQPQDLADKVNRYTRNINMISRPSVRLKNLGRFGNYFNSLIDHAYDNVQLRTADKLMGYNKVIRDIPKNQLDELELKVADVLEGHANINSLPKEGRRVAANLRGLFSEIKKDAITYGIWTKQQVESMSPSHYFPRVTDVGKLESKEGKEQFVRNFMSINWSAESLRDTYKALTGETSSSAKAFVDSLRNSNGDLILNRSMANKLYAKTKNFEDFKGGSTHLDHQRKLNLGEYDKLMHPFRIREFSKIADRYLHDTLNRIEHAKIFGAKHERALNLSRNIADEVGSVNPNKADNASEFSLKMYFNQLGMKYHDNVIDAHIGTSKALKTLNGKMTAFEILNLLFAQILQPSAAFVNGTASMSRVMPLHQAFNNNFKSLVKTFSKDPQWENFTSRAASGLNVGFIDNVSEATMEATLFGRSSFNDQYLSWINTPQGWLKFTGLLKLERFNQRWATIQGKALVEHLLENKGKIDNGVITDPKIIRETKTMFDELDLGWNRTDEVSLNDVHRASMRFNRAVSFTDGARELPQTMRSPYATLARLFSTFMYRQSAFLSDNIYHNGIKKGNLKPLAAYLTAATMMGYPVREVLEFVTADDREYTNTVAFIKNIETAAGFGRLFALLGDSVQGSNDFYRALAGPAWSDLLKLTEGTANSIVNLDIKPLAGAVVDVLPRLPFGAKERAAESLGIKQKQRYQQTEQDIWDYLKLDYKRKRDTSGGSLGMSAGMSLSLSSGMGI